MPELPEVEVVRRGLEAHASGRTVATAQVLHPRAVRRHLPGAADLSARVAGRALGPARRRGKYLWLPLLDSGSAGPESSEDHEEALVGHLGMSGQLLIEPASAPDETHLRVRFTFADGGPELRFVDQRTFGALAVQPLVGSLDDPADPVPASVQHIARDLLDPALDEDALIRALRSRHTQIKRALLDQSLVSGVGNIYADEALWRARLHGARATDALRPAQLREVLDRAREVMVEALSEGGTSFDRLYVDVNGASGYFDRSLAAYGQEGRPCLRCGRPIRRESFMNRSSFSCPRCQPRPRARRAGD